MPKEDAVAVRDACLKSMKERLFEKASIIQSRLDEVSADYQRRQLAYSRNADSMTVEETEEYVKFCNQALFKIHILEKRLAKVKEYQGGGVEKLYCDMSNHVYFLYSIKNLLLNVICSWMLSYVQIPESRLHTN